MNKTGTTSLKKTFEDLGYLVGNQRAAEHMLPVYKMGNFKPIIEYTKNAQVFQDIPFSLPDTYKHLSKAYPNAYFILTVRDSAEQWVNSITTYHSKLFGQGRIPSKMQLVDSKYVYQGFMWDAIQSIAPVKEKDPYQTDILLKAYVDYNYEVEQYFKNQSYRFLKINLSEKGSYQKLIDFLGITSQFDEFPWKNKTIEIPKSK